MAGKPLPSGAGRASPALGKDVTSQFVAAPAAMSVAELVGRIKESLLDAFPRAVAVIGQISNFKRHSSGHLYFSLKDQAACIDAVMFRADAASVRFDCADGLEVVAEGRVDVYEKQGRLQLYVRRLSPRGTGALELAFRQLKERLGKEGLFDPAHKVPLARYPRAIGVVTSPIGAAVRDIAATLRRRWRAARVYLLPVKVQGEGSAGEIANAIALLDAQAARLQIDTIILARGGGSLEDLWAFNEEPLARAIYAAVTPVVAGVGHETDFTIADFVADVRAATPTAAAELATPDGAALRQRVDASVGRLLQLVRDVLRHARAQLVGLGRSAVFRDPTGRVRAGRQALDELSGRMTRGLESNCHRLRQELSGREQTLAELHPRRLRERATAALQQAGHRLAWALGRRAKLAGDRLREAQALLAAAHPRHRLRVARQQLAGLARQLESMSYRAVLKRGFSVTRLEGARILRAAAEVAEGDWLQTELADGKVRSQVGGADAQPIPAALAPPRRPAGKPPAGPTLFAPDEGKC